VPETIQGDTHALEAPMRAATATEEAVSTEANARNGLRCFGRPSDGEAIPTERLVAVGFHRQPRAQTLSASSPECFG